MVSKEFIGLFEIFVFLSFQKPLKNPQQTEDLISHSKGKGT